MSRDCCHGSNQSPPLKRVRHFAITARSAGRLLHDNARTLDLAKLGGVTPAYAARAPRKAKLGGCTSRGTICTRNERVLDM